MSPEERLQKAALALTGAGISIVPCNLANKKPTIRWKRLQSKIAEATDVRAWFKSEKVTAIAVICGEVSGNLEVLDFDYTDNWQRWIDTVKKKSPTLLDRVALARSKSGGYHIFYRCPQPAGNQKLAQGMRLDRKDDKARELTRQTLIETRGEGGYVIVTPTHGYSMEYGNLLDLLEISQEDRDTLLDSARLFHEFADEDEEQRPEPVAKPKPAPGSDVPPGEDYAATDHFREVLKKHGWQMVKAYSGKEDWVRPGKKKADGISATWNYQDSNFFYVFSTNAQPFDAGRGYNPFSIYAMLEHGSDFKAAARELGQAGYGTQKSVWKHDCWTPPPGDEDAPQGFAQVDTAERLDDIPPPEDDSHIRVVGQDECIDGSERFRIVTTNEKLSDLSDRAMAAVCKANNPPRIFLRGTDFVRITLSDSGSPTINAMNQTAVRGLLDRVADWVALDYRRSPPTARIVFPPVEVAADIVNMGSWSGLPGLKEIIETPTLRPDGTVVTAPGYDEPTKLYHHPNADLNMPDLEEKPDKYAVEAALELLDDMLHDFPWETPSDRANALAAIITPVIRPAIDGPVPLCLIDKPQQGTGASLLIQCISEIATGRQENFTTCPDNDDEWRKKITTLLMQSPRIIVLDNVDRKLMSQHLAMVLTSETWTDRILGASQLVQLPNRAVWVATGNNVRLGGDIPRRCYWVRMDPKVARPWQREGFKIDPLLPWVVENRGKLVHAILTLATAWFQAGRPEPEAIPSMGTFDGWAKIVGGILSFAGVKGFMANVNKMYEQADQDTPQWMAFLESWNERFGEHPMKVSGVVKEATDIQEFADVVPESIGNVEGRGFGTKLGRALAKRKEVRYPNGLRITEGPRMARAATWVVSKGEGTNPGGLL
jgi:hypothetical protein